MEMIERPDPRLVESWCREGVAHDHGACGRLWNPNDQHDDRGELLTARIDSMGLTLGEMRDVLVMLSDGSPNQLEAALNFVQRMRDIAAAPKPGGNDVLALARAGSCADCGGQLGDVVDGRSGCPQCGSWFDLRLAEIGQA